MKRLAGLALLAFLGGCQSDELERHVEVPPHQPRLLTPDVAGPNEPAELQALSSKLRQRIGEDDTVALALGRSPELSILRQETKAARARLFQSGQYSYNPAVLVGVDDLPVTANHSGQGIHDYAEKVQFGVVQTIEFPTKHYRRIDLGEALVRATDADYQAKLREVRTNARTAFAEILAARDRLAIAHMNLDLAGRVHRDAAARVAARTAAPIEETKTEIDELKAQNEVRSAERDVIATKARLSGILGDPTLKVGEAEGALAIAAPELDVAALAPLIETHPSLQSKLYSVEAAEANLALQRSALYPDPTLLFTYNRINGDLDTLTANLLVPIPIINRNEGAIREARLSIDKAEADANAMRATLMAQLQQVYSTYDAARRNAQLLREKSLPAAERAQMLAEEGWKAGKFRYLDVVDAQRGLASTRADYLAALLDLNRSIAQLEGLTGKRIEELH